MSCLDFTAKLLAQQQWRTGRTVGRTLYRMVAAQPSDDDVLIGVMDRPVDAALIAAAPEALTFLLDVADAGRDVVAAKAGVDMRDPDTVAPLTAADERLRDALAALDGAP